MWKMKKDLRVASLLDDILNTTSTRGDYTSYILIDYSDYSSSSTRGSLGFT